MGLTMRLYTEEEVRRLKVYFLEFLDRHNYPVNNYSPPLLDAIEVELIGFAPTVAVGDIKEVKESRERKIKV